MTDNFAFALATDPDLILDERRDASPCPRCKYPDPARLGHDDKGTYGCSECLEYRRCFLCRRWTGEEHGNFVHLVVWSDGRLVDVCEPCYEKADVMVPLDMTEDDDE